MALPEFHLHRGDSNKKWLLGVYKMSSFEMKLELGI